MTGERHSSAAALEHARRLVAAAGARVSVERLAGREVALVKAGSELRGPCPLCARGAARGPRAVEPVKGRRKGKGRSESFAVKGDRWRCYRCGLFGDVVDLERELRGGTTVEAARRLAGDEPLPATVTPRAKPRPEPEGPSASARLAAELWREARPAAGSLVETYLAARGIVPAVIAAALGNLRFHPAAKWFWCDRSRRWATAPAMIVLVVVAGPDGRPRATGGVHATYLAPDGRAKASAEDAPAKVMWGPQTLDGRPGGTWLIGPSLEGHAGDGLAVGAEGIETGLSLASLHWLRTGSLTRCWAALSLDRLQGRLLRDEARCVDLVALTPDPERPAFTWPGVERVRVGVDRDMSPLAVRARTGRGKAIEMELGPEARARICARLTVAAWRAAGASEARAVAPPPGMDFNDELRRVRARERVVTA